MIGGKKSSFGMKTNLTLIEQRQSLPIYKLREDLIKVSFFFEEKNGKQIFFINTIIDIEITIVFLGCK